GQTGDRRQDAKLIGGQENHVPRNAPPAKRAASIFVLGNRRRARGGLYLPVSSPPCHSAQALAMLAAPTDSEREVLGDIGWQRNEVVLHSDPRWLPERQRAWASWNYRLSDGDRARACVTYNMNILQGLPAGAPLFCVTLNPDAPVDDRYVWQRFVYEHPLFNPQSWSAQLRREEINGQQRSWYCGAYWYNGFHEDGVRSALDVVQGIAAAEGN
ncbi:hypothetical protein M8371_30170, partial [Klebsiella pneumoniae]|nr:hypothetical protein [Klebsiella pneumoniae]